MPKDNSILNMENSIEYMLNIFSSNQTDNLEKDTLKDKDKNKEVTKKNINTNKDDSIDEFIKFELGWII